MAHPGRKRPDAVQPFALAVGGQVMVQLRALGSRLIFGEGQVLFVEGDPSDEILIIETGLVKVHISSEHGPELILGLYGPGELIGEMGGLGEGPRTANCTGHSAGTATRVPSAKFRAFLRQRPTAMVHVLEVAQQRLLRADRARLSYLADDVTARVAHQLLTWAQVYGTSGAKNSVVVANISHRELAQSVAANEKTVDQALRKLTAAGLVATGRLRFELLDVPGLRRWLEQRR